jgi:hypothetical protein
MKLVFLAEQGLEWDIITTESLHAPHYAWEDICSGKVLGPILHEWAQQQEPCIIPDPAF